MILGIDGAIPLMNDQQPRVSYDRSRARRIVMDLESDRRGAEGDIDVDEMVFDQESFAIASKMRQYLFPDLGWLSLEKIAECMAGRLQVQTWQTGWLANFSLTRLWKIKGRRML